MTERILIIDDDVDTLKLVGLMLERQGYEIAVANNGSVGLSKASVEQPDLILLDIMMPDLDGFEVTRRLRADPALSHIPIIMFTAKTMVDDKVAGFEAGVDDYLTKPTHPAELTAHVKAVLTRTAQTRIASTDRARIIGFIGSRAGLGTSTLALNVSILLKQQSHDVILVELNPGHGTVALELNIPHADGVSNLLKRSLKDIHLRSVDSELINHSTGLRLLLSSSQPNESMLQQSVPQMEATVKNLATMCTALIVDFGSGLKPFASHLIQLCDHIIVVVEPVFPSNVIGRTLIEQIERDGVPRHKLSLALINRVRTSLQIPWRQVETELGIELGGIISPAPEQAHQASQAGTPLVITQPDSLVSDQLRKLAEHVAVHLQLQEDRVAS
jgi:DNA-binding response OmpR family regulator